MTYASTGSQAKSAPPPSTESGSDGFSLLETLSALTIFAIAFAALTGTFTSGLRGAEATRQYRAAIIIAENLLAGSETATEKSNSGRTGEFRWTMKVDPYRSAEPRQNPPEPWALETITVSVSWAEGRSFTLNKVRMVRGNGRS